MKYSWGFQCVICDKDAQSAGCNFLVRSQLLQ
jgi:hypothetical protein